MADSEPRRRSGTYVDVVAMYDHQPNEVAESFLKALAKLGIKAEMLDPAEDDVHLTYRIYAKP